MRWLCRASGMWPPWSTCQLNWVVKELNSLLFKFFWSGKREKVSRKVVVQPRDRGGFAVVSIEHKVHALLFHWIKRYVVSPNSWVSLLTFWCLDRFGVDPSDILSSPFLFYPPFYASLLWPGVLSVFLPTNLLCFPSVAFPGLGFDVYGVL